MPRFLFLLFPALTGAEARPLVEWVAREASSGVVRSGARLESGTRVRRAHGVTTVGDADPPWGFLVVEAEDTRAALAIAAACPASDPGAIDLYRLDLANALGDALVDAATLR